MYKNCANRNHKDSNLPPPQKKISTYIGAGSEIYPTDLTGEKLIAAVGKSVVVAVAVAVVAVAAAAVAAVVVAVGAWRSLRTVPPW